LPYLECSAFSFIADCWREAVPLEGQLWVKSSPGGGFVGTAELWSEAPAQVIRLTLLLVSPSVGLLWLLHEGSIVGQLQRRWYPRSVNDGCRFLAASPHSIFTNCDIAVNSDIGRLLNVGLVHSGLIFAALMIGHHFSISAFCNSASAAQ
jgi:hypothetical protein